MMKLLNPFLGRVTEKQMKPGEKLLFTISSPMGKKI